MALERQCTILIPNESSAADKDDSGDFLKDMEQNDGAVKKAAVKRLIRNSINGDNSSGALMQVIRYCVPFDDHELKKLVYVYFETVDKTDATTGKLREEMILVCNFLRKDLMHANEFVRGCALRFVAKLKEFELLEPLVKPIKENLDHRHSYVRRNAVLALHNAYRVSETLCVDAPEIMERQLKIETDNSARRNALNMLIHCAPARAVAFVLANISQLNSLGDIIQIVALELIRKVCKQSPQEKGNYMGAIFDMLSSTSPSVVFQCATTIIQLSSSPTALKSAAAALVSLLVDHSDNNVRLVTLDRLIALKQKHPLVLQGMVLDLCRVLQAPSPDIRSRSLALITELVTSSNVDNVLSSLKKELSSRGSDTLPADSEFKASIVASLVALTSNFPDTAATICNTLLDIVTDAGAVAVDAMQGVRELIAVFPDIRLTATQRLRDVIGSVRQGKVLRIVVACLAEFSVGSDALKASLDETFTMIGPLPLHVSDVPEAKVTVSHDRPKVLADGSYASQSSIGGGDGASAASSRHPLVISLLQGDYNIGVSIASSLSKLLVLYKSSGNSDQAEVSRLCVSMILLCSSVMRLTKVDGAKGMDSDSVEKLCSIMALVADNSSDAFLQQWIATSAKLYSDVVQVKVGKSRKVTVQDNSVQARVDDAITFRLLHSRTSAKDLADDDDVDFLHGEDANEFGKRLNKVMALTAFGDPLYCEAIVTMHSYDIVLDIFIVNRTADTLANISLDLATVGDLRLVERLQPFSLPAHKSTTLRQSVKVSSTETGVIYGAITYDLASLRGGGLSPPDLRTVSINLADIHMDVMDYIKPAQCSDPAFRKMWSEFEWENKVIICTVIKDTVEFLDHIMHVTNMSCLTPRTLLQTGCRFVAANLYAKSVSATLAAFPLFCTPDCMQVFGEDALLNISVEREASGSLAGAIRIRAKTQGIALSLGDRVTAKQKGK